MGICPRESTGQHGRSLQRDFGKTPRRRVLLEGIRAVAFELRKAGCRRVWIDGSFITTKRNPSDFDGCWDYQGVSLGLLRKTTPLLVFDNGCEAQKAKCFPRIGGLMRR